MRVSNVIKNSSEIVEYLTIHWPLLTYTPRHTGDMIFTNTFGTSHFSSLEDINIPEHLRNLILQNFTDEETIPIAFMQIQKYEIGEYILPHKDNYLNKLRLFQLTTNEHNGLTVQEGDTYVVYPDQAGSEILFNRSAWHWVNPVTYKRYSLVIGYH